MFLAMCENSFQLWQGAVALLGQGCMGPLMSVTSAMDSSLGFVFFLNLQIHKTRSVKSIRYITDMLVLEVL